MEVRPRLSEAFVNSSKDAIPYARPCLDEDDIQAVIEALKSPMLTQGPQIDAFEAEFAKQTGDFAALSLTDLKLIALLHTLEIEVNGGKYIRSEPKVRFQHLILLPLYG